MFTMCGVFALHGKAQHLSQAITFDPEKKLTASEAAYLCCVSEATIRVWAHRGTLRDSGTDPATGRKIYRAIDVARAEIVTREKARR